MIVFWVHDSLLGLQRTQAAHFPPPPSSMTYSKTYSKGAQRLVYVCDIVVFLARWTKYLMFLELDLLLVELWKGDDRDKAPCPTAVILCFLK